MKGFYFWFLRHGDKRLRAAFKYAFARMARERPDTSPRRVMEVLCEDIFKYEQTLNIWLRAMDQNTPTPSWKKQQRKFSLNEKRSLQKDLDQIGRRLSEKPKKEELVTAFHDSLTRMSQSLNLSGISTIYIEAWRDEPWHFDNLKKAYKFIKAELMPVCIDVDRKLNSKALSEWDTLVRLNPHHSDIKALGNLQAKVRKVWKVRPRFKVERNRVRDEGY